MEQLGHLISLILYHPFSLKFNLCVSSRFFVVSGPLFAFRQNQKHTNYNPPTNYYDLAKYVYWNQSEQQNQLSGFLLWQASSIQVTIICFYNNQVIGRWYISIINLVLYFANKYMINNSFLADWGLTVDLIIKKCILMTSLKRFIISIHACMRPNNIANCCGQ